jgi:hypothetical protein
MAEEREEEERRYEPLVVPTGYRVYPADGFATTVIQAETTATIQLSYWIVDGTPDSENNQVPYSDTRHYKVARTKHALQTAVQLRPDVAFQLATNIIEALSKIPDAIRERYSIPNVSLNLK